MREARAWSRLGALVAAVSVFAPAVAVAKVQTRPSKVTEGTLLIATDAAKRKAAAFPLQRTQVTAEILGFTSQVRVRQTFNNPFTVPLEAIYVFPLPQDAAVGEMTMRIGKRVIKAQIKTRAQARKTYERARSQGRKTALLEQERPNIFTQSVANIDPGAEILVELVYDVPLRYHAGTYEFVYPMVVGPRYIPASPKVADAAKITPPVTPPGSRAGHEVSVEVSIDAGLPIKKLISPTHKVNVTRPKTTKTTAVRVALAKGHRIPNKDFVVRFTVAGNRPAMAVRAARGKHGGHFALMFEPPLRTSPAAATPKEVFFVIDTSGSMRGEPLTRVKQAMRYALRNLNPRDTFQIIRFGDSASSLSATPLTNTSANVQRGLTFINGLSGGGGTQMIKGIRAALAQKSAPGRLRVVCFMTDGYIGNEAHILGEISSKLRSDTRLFAFGVGSAVNRYLLERMAELGRGAAIYSLHDEKATKAIKGFYDRIRSPVMTDIKVEWGGLDATEVSPKRIPDLFSGQPLVLVGRFKRSGEAVVKVHGRIAGKRVRYALPVTLPVARSNNAALARTWARAHIKRLSTELLRNPRKNVVAQITRLALRHSLMSKYTSFVAVERGRRKDGGVYRTYHVPVAMPVGVSYEAIYGQKAPRRGFTSTVGTAAGSSGGGGGEDSDNHAPTLTLTDKPGAFARAHRSGRWNLGVGAGLGFRLSGETQALSSVNLSLSRRVASNLRVGPEVLLQIPSLDSGDAMVSALLDLVYTGVLDGLVSFTVAAGALLPKEGFGLAYSGVLDLELPFSRALGTGLRLRLDGNRPRGERRSEHSVSVGIQLSW